MKKITLLLIVILSSMTLPITANSLGGGHSVELLAAVELPPVEKKTKKERKKRSKTRANRLQKQKGITAENSSTKGKVFLILGLSFLFVAILFLVGAILSAMSGGLAGGLIAILLGMFMIVFGVLGLVFTIIGAVFLSKRYSDYREKKDTRKTEEKKEDKVREDRKNPVEGGWDN